MCTTYINLNVKRTGKVTKINLKKNKPSVQILCLSRSCTITLL